MRAPWTIDMIGLLEREERRQRTLTRLAAAGVAQRVRMFWGLEPLGYPSPEGCRESHLALWRESVEDNQPIFVMEDDVTLAPLFNVRLEAALYELELYDPDWDVLFLGGHDLGSHEHGDYTARTSGVLQTHAYIAKPAFLSWVLSWVDQFPGLPIDQTWAGRMAERHVYRCWPWLAGQEDGWSDTARRMVTGRDLPKEETWEPPVSD